LRSGCDLTAEARLVPGRLPPPGADPHPVATPLSLGENSYHRRATATDRNRPTCPQG
jgi:hypothetical protein